MRLCELSMANRIVALCCAWPRTQDIGNRLRTLVDGVEDWAPVMAAIARHRVADLAEPALRETGSANLPVAVREALARATQGNRLHSLRQAAELIRLHGGMAAAGIPMAEVKGLTLARLAYGGLGRKRSLDLDVLVPPEHAAGAVAVLQREGYVHDAGAMLTARQVTACVRSRKDLPFKSAAGVKLELHWRLTGERAALRDIGGPETWQRVPLGAGEGQAVPTLAMADLVAYIGVHGTLHDWARLKWLADLGALVAQADAATVAQWQDHAHRIGAGRGLDTGLELVRRLLETGPGARDPAAVAPLVASALLTIEAPWPLPDGTLAEKLALARNEWAIRRRLLGRAIGLRAFARSYLFVEKDILALPLPARLRYLYPALRGPLWARDRWRAGRAA